MSRTTSDLEIAAAALRGGGVVLHATEGVWGLACDPWSRSAVDKIIQLKGRGAEKGFILIGACADMFAAQLGSLSVDHRAQVLASWPGSHTWIVPDEQYPEIIRGGRSTLACRVPGHTQARELCQAFGAPLVSTSANASGAASITNAADAVSTFGDRVEVVLEGEVDAPGKASTIHGPDGEILR